MAGLLGSADGPPASLRERFEAGETVLAPGCYDALGGRLVEEAGYGNSVNVIHTVREYEAAGVAAIHLKDQVMPKNCGHLEGKEVVPAREMVAKIEAAVAARRSPAVGSERLRSLGFSLVIFPLTLLFVATQAMRAALARVKVDGTPIELLRDMLPIDEFVSFIGLPEIRELELRFAEE